MIEVTDKMIAAARDASIELNGHCLTYFETKAMLKAVFAIVDDDGSRVPDMIRRAYERGVEDERALTALIGPLRKSEERSAAIDPSLCGNPSCDVPWHQGR